MTDKTPARLWGWYAVILGFLGVPAYLFSAVMPLGPVELSRGLFFAFGPLFTFGAVAFGMWLRRQAGGVLVVFAMIAAAAAGVIQNVMALIQTLLITQYLPELRTLEGTERESFAAVLSGLNDLQLSLDLSFDVWVSAATVLFAIAGRKVLPIGRVLALAGVFAGGSALIMNFLHFPTPPAQAGGIDLGPAVGVWFALAQIAVLYQLLRKTDPDSQKQSRA